MISVLRSKLTFKQPANLTSKILIMLNDVVLTCKFSICYEASSNEFDSAL